MSAESPVDVITPVARRLGVPLTSLHLHGRDKAKIDLVELGPITPRGRLVLVSGMTPTPAGEGKTTTSIGLADGLRHLGRSACVALREPSLGPCFGHKGGGTGFGRSRLIPTADINLHFTGDFHAVTSAHDLLAALVDNHLHHGQAPALDPDRVVWRRVLDVNDRALRSIEVGRGAKSGPARAAGFDITAASEVMAILALANDRDDLRARLGRMVIGHQPDGTPVTAGELRAVGAMMALLRDALDPNLVQTVEGTPALVHAGPFANIAHGTSSVVASRVGLALADWVITEAGFGFDLGGEKFFDIVCRSSGLCPALVVIVASVRALRLHGGRPLAELGQPDPAAVQRGLINLRRHVEAARRFGVPVVVARNTFPGDTKEEHAVIERACVGWDVPTAAITATVDGAAGGAALAQVVMDTAGTPSGPAPCLYSLDAPLPTKLEAIATKIYGARGVLMSALAAEQVMDLERTGFGRLPVCMAKTQASFTDDPSRLGAPEDFDVTIRRFELAAGAGFVVALAGAMMRMPGLPARPRAHEVDLIGDDIVGIG